jgi:SsrA-binding protein
MSLFIPNKKASHDYEFIKKFEAGLALDGWEVKSIKAGNCSIKEAYVDEFKGEMWVYGMHITKWKQGDIANMKEVRPRKLLLSKGEINYLNGRKQQKGLTIVPADLHISRKFIKMTLALARGTKEYEKRDKEKKREIERDIKKERII